MPRARPGLGRVMANAAGAAVRIGMAVAMGEPVLVPELVRADRLAQCQACPHMLDERCNLCGCRLGRPVLDKTRYATEQCPAIPPRWLRCSQ